MAKRYLFQARDSVTGEMHYWDTTSAVGASGYPGPNVATEKARLAVNGVPVLAYLFRATDSVTGDVYHWTTTSYLGDTGYPGPNDPEDVVRVAAHTDGKRYLFQARDSVTGQMHYWTTTSPVGATGYPGPNTAQETTQLAMHGDSAGGETIPIVLTGVSDGDESGTLSLIESNIITLVGVSDPDQSGTVDLTYGFGSVIPGTLTSLWFAFDQHGLSLGGGSTQAIKMRVGSALEGIADGSSTLTYQATGWAGGGGKPSIRKGGTLSNSSRTGIRGMGLGFGSSANMRRSWTFSCAADLNNSNGRFINHGGGPADSSAAASACGYVDWNEGSFNFFAPYGVTQIAGNSSQSSGPTPNRTNPFIVAWSLEWNGSQLTVRRCNHAVGGTQLYTPLVSSNAALGTNTNLNNIAMGYKPFDSLVDGFYLTSSQGANDFCGWAIWDNYAASDAELLAICNQWAALYPIT